VTLTIKNLALGALALSITLSSGFARAQQEEPAEKSDEEIPEPPESDEDPEEKEAVPAAKPAAAVKLDANAAASAEADAEPHVVAANENTGTPRRPPVYGKASDWSITPYGYARLDTIWDSTQSFEDGYHPFLIQRVGTYRGDHPRSTLTARDSRLGMFIGAPTFAGMRSYAQIELDFFGITPTDVKRHDAIVFGPLRIRHAYYKLETPVIDVVAGQYWDLFGWGTHYFPATVAFLGVPGMVYHRDPQLRFEKGIHLGQLEIKPAIAAVRPGQKDSGFPDAQAGLKLAFEGWTGAAMSGLGKPSISPISLGVSGVYRRFEVPVFRTNPASESRTESGYGLHVGALLPVIPAENADDRGNALTLTGEFSTGTGIADLYTNMDGGARFPVLSNPLNTDPALPYLQNIDNGLVTFDRNFNLATINWRGFVAGLQYYLPIANGAVWLSGVYSQVESDNIRELTPDADLGGIFSKMEYIDASVGVEITPAILVGFSFQTVKQWFGDLTRPEPVFGEVPSTMGPLGSLSVAGTGGEQVTARNNRLQLATTFMF
jgi:hypothetical protein